MKLRKALESQRPPNLSLADQILNEEGCGIVADFLAQHPQFINIELRGCNINGRGFERICRQLPPETRTVLAEWNAIGNGVAALCDTLLNPANCIQLVDLKNNRIQAESCARIGQMLKQNQSLQSLNLKWNEIGEKGAQYLWEALHYNRTLKFLDLSCNKIPEGLATQIRNKIEQNRSSELMSKNEANIKQSQSHQNQQQSQPQLHRTLPRVQVATATTSTPINQVTQKNDQIRVALLKEQIDQELRTNRVTAEELTNRMNQLKSDVLMKESAVAVARRRYDELINEKQLIEADHAQIKDQFDQLSERGDERQQNAMNEYITKNKYILGLENDYMRELQNIRNDNKKQVEQIHMNWTPRLQQTEGRYQGLMRRNDQLNQELLQFKELFLKMRLDHDENTKAIEQRLLIEEKGKYYHQLDLMKKKEMEVASELKGAENRSTQQMDDMIRLEQNIVRDRQQVEDALQHEREQCHKIHLEMSKRNIKQEKYINRNIVVDAHIDKLVRKIEETNYVLNTMKDSTMEDMQQRRHIHEQQYVIHKQNQNLTHQRTLELELLLRNQEGKNNKMKAEYEKLCHLLQGRIQTTVAEVCRVELRLN